MMSHICNSWGDGPVYVGGTGGNHIPVNISAGGYPEPGDVYAVRSPGAGLLGGIVGAVLGGPLGFVVGAIAGNAISPPRAEGFIKVGSNMEAIPCDENGKEFVPGGSTK
jgi:hypothetical protein